MKNRKDPGGVKSAIISAIAVLATIAATLLITSFKERSETDETQTESGSYSEYAPVGDADAPILHENESEVKEYLESTDPAQNANVAFSEMGVSE